MRGWLRQAAGGLPRTFWLLWTGTLINRLGAFVVIFLAIYLTGERGFSQSQAGLVIGLWGLGGAIGTMTGGVPMAVVGGGWGDCIWRPARAASVRGHRRRRQMAEAEIG